MTVEKFCKEDLMAQLNPEAAAIVAAGTPDVTKFYEAFIASGPLKDAEALVKLDGEAWSLPRFQMDQPVWAAGRPAMIVSYGEEGKCGGHPDEYAYGVRFIGTSENWMAWPYCESQLRERD